MESDNCVEDGKHMNHWIAILLVIVGLFLIMYVVALIKRPGSRYKDKPDEQNPMQGKMVRFVENANEKENADGVRGHLEAVGPSNHRAGIYEKVIKRCLDLILSFGGLVILSPLFLALSLWIVIDDPGPVLFKQKRIGKDKQYFALHKFRSMKTSTPHNVPTHMLENPEQYITKSGKFIRTHSLDELPQIWDIFIMMVSMLVLTHSIFHQSYQANILLQKFKMHITMKKFFRKIILKLV